MWGKQKVIFQIINNIKNFFLQQHKLEIKNNNFFVRGYVTEDKAGDSYDMVFPGINIIRAWKDDNTWFGEYVGAYLTATLGGATNEEAVQKVFDLKKQVTISAPPPQWHDFRATSCNKASVFHPL